jgi:hypothetical protein
MNKLCIFVGLTLFSWIGWWLGAKYGIMTAFVLSSMGSLLGVYAGWKVNMTYFS